MFWHAQIPFLSPYLLWSKINQVKVDPSKANQTKIKKTRELQIWLLRLFMRDNVKCNISHAPYHRLKRYSILNYYKCIGIIDLEGPDITTNIIMKLGRGATFYVRHTTLNTRCREYKKNQVKVDPSRATNPT